MHTRLLELLRRLSPAELAAFETFLASPFFNRNEKAPAMFRYLSRFAPGFEDAELHAEGAFAEVWGHDKPFDKAALNRLNSQLFKLAEQFIAHSAMETDAIRRNLYLMRRYEELGLESHLHATWQRLESLWSQPADSMGRLAGRLEAELILADWLNRSDDRTGEANLQNLNDSLDLFFFAFKLKFLNAMLSRGAVSKTDYRFSWKEAIQQAMEQDPQWRQDPLVELQFRIMQVLEHPGAMVSFDALHRFLSEQLASLPAADLRDGYLCLQNAAKLVFPVGVYYGKLFDLYREQLDAGILYENGRLHHGVFRNVVNTALNVNERDWSARFISGHRRRISPDAYAEAAYLQNMAMWYFHQGDYRKAQEYLMLSNPVDVYYKLADRSLLARIYFELRESEALDNLLNAFAKFVFDQQRKIAAPKVRSYRTFINGLRQLHNLIQTAPSMYMQWSRHKPARSASDRESVARLAAEMVALPVFYGQKWLLEKMKELNEPEG